MHVSSPRFRVAACLATVTLVVTVPVAQNPPAATTGHCSEGRFAPAITTIREALTGEALPSVAIAVAERGRVTCEAAFGWADRGRQIAATPSTMYSLASISKPFTATAVMRLVEQGTLDLGRPANDYLGEARLRAFEGNAEDATLKRLLTHTAGLPLHYQFFYEGGPAVHDMDAAIARYGVIVYPPGERYFYANFGYGVLERILERAAKRPYAEVLRTAVLAPLGLTQTMVSDGGGLDGGRAALRYGSDGQRIRPYTFDHVGASGVWSSARDLIRFGIFHLGHDTAGGTRVLSRDARRVMQREHAAADAPGRARGLGWGIADRAGWRQVAHTGSMPGVSTILSLYPEADVAVVVLTNVNDSGAVARVERALASAALPATLPTALAQREAQGGVAGPPSAPGRAGAGVAAAIGGRWTGWVQLPHDRIRVTLEVRTDDDLRIRFGEEPEASVQAARISDKWFTGRTSGRVAGPDAAPPDARGEHRTTVTLALRGERLSGWVSAMSTAVPTYGAVSFPIALSKRSDSDERRHD